MKYTGNYNLKKPEGTDVVNVEDFNDNADIIDQQLKTLDSNKVDKVTGKGLSTNDYTTAEKDKLAGIEAGAEVNTITSVNTKTGAVVVNKSDVGLSNVDNVKQASKAEHEALDTKVSTHMVDNMPHQFVDNGKTYKWGFRTKNGVAQFIYEEVI